MKPGDRVYFGRPNGEQTLGEVVKVNRTSVKVRQLEERGQYRNRPVGTTWRVPLALCRPADASATPLPPSPPPASKPKRTEAEIIADLQSVECALSPEILSCDGELPVSQIRRRAASLRRWQAELLRELGRPLNPGEVWSD
jgi:hypothetical protein